MFSERKLLEDCQFRATVKTRNEQLWVGTWQWAEEHPLEGSDNYGNHLMRIGYNVFIASSFYFSTCQGKPCSQLTASLLSSCLEQTGIGVPSQFPCPAFLHCRWVPNPCQKDLPSLPKPSEWPKELWRGDRKQAGSSWGLCPGEHSPFLSEERPEFLQWPLKIVWPSIPICSHLLPFFSYSIYFSHPVSLFLIAPGLLLL